MKTSSLTIRLDNDLEKLLIQASKQTGKTRSEIARFQVLEINDKAKRLAELLLLGNAIPQKCPEDALHIAVAAVNEIGFIVTLTFL